MAMNIMAIELGCFSQMVVEGCFFLISGSLPEPWVTSAGPVSGR